MELIDLYGLFSRIIPKDKDVLLSYSVAIFIPSETENLKQNPYRVLTNLQLTFWDFLCCSKLELPTVLPSDDRDCIIKNLVSKPRLCNQFFDIYMHKVEKKKLSFFELMSDPICPVLSNLNYSFIVINILNLAFKSNVRFMLTLCWSPKRHLSS